VIFFKTLRCYNEDVSIEDASDINNLKMVPWQDNLAKRTFEKIKK